MAVNDYVMVPPQVSHYPDWEKGQIIEVENKWNIFIMMIINKAIKVNI